MKVLIIGTFFIAGAYAQSGAAGNRSGSSGFAGVSADAGKPIEVRGQSRNLNMLLKLNSEREAIDFIKLRKNYKKEIQSQSF